jgi:hypothetical protein
MYIDNSFITGASSSVAHLRVRALAKAALAAEEALD